MIEGVISEVSSLFSLESSEDGTINLLFSSEIEKEEDAELSGRFLCKKLLLTTRLPSLMLADDTPKSMKVRTTSQKYKVLEK